MSNTKTTSSARQSSADSYHKNSEKDNMTDKQQPEALRLANALEYCDASVARQAINELRLQYAELETLRAGYAAARLEIASLQARIKTMAEEHADELMVAHLDGRMRAAQPDLNLHCKSTQKRLATLWGFVPAPQQEAQEPVAWYVTGGSRLLDEDEAKAEARHIGGTARAIPVYTAPQPSPAAQGDALDAARLEWLENDVGCRVFHLGKSWYTRDNFGMPYRKRASLRAAIDAARLEKLKR